MMLIPMELDSLNSSSQAASWINSTVVASLIGALGGVLGAFIVAYFNNRLNRKVLETNKLIERRKNLSRKLNEFYLPLKSMLGRSRNLFKLFAEGKPEEFRVLTYLLNSDQTYSDGNPVELSKNDEALLKQIFELGTNIRRLIDEKSGIIDDEEFIGNYVPDSKVTDVVLKEETSLLDLAYNHFEIIQLAHDGDLRGESEKYEQFVYPRELNSILDDKIEVLRREIESLSKKIDSL